MGLAGGFKDDMGQSAVDLYSAFHQPNPEDPTWQWPFALLPICHWGCAIYSCVDCSTNDGRILVWDPDSWEEGTPVETALRPSHATAAAWFGAWAAGVNIWKEMFPDTDDESA